MYKNIHGCIKIKISWLYITAMIYTNISFQAAIMKYWDWVKVRQGQRDGKR